MGWLLVPCYETTCTLSINCSALAGRSQRSFLRLILAPGARLFYFVDTRTIRGQVPDYFILLILRLFGGHYWVLKKEKSPSSVLYFSQNLMPEFVKNSCPFVNAIVTKPETLKV